MQHLRHLSLASFGSGAAFVGIACFVRWMLPLPQMMHLPLNGVFI
jgi:hypothetical protein